MSHFTSLNNYKIYPFKNEDAFLDYIEKKNLKKILVALNGEKLVKENNELREIVSHNIGYPDGIGAVLALKQKGYNAKKIPGAEFWLHIVERFYKTKTFYLVGAKEEVIQATVEKLKKNYTGINILNFRNGYLKDDDYKKLREDIMIKKPDIIYVAMGSPKQEFIMRDLKNKHKALYMGLGGSFDVYTGNKQRAPEAWQYMGMEWAYRLLREPSRVFRQKNLLKFAYRLITNKL